MRMIDLWPLELSAFIDPSKDADPECLRCNGTGETSRIVHHKSELLEIHRCPRCISSEKMLGDSQLFEQDERELAIEEV